MNLKKVTNNVSLPVIASGGVGNLEHFYLGHLTKSTGLLAASVFHSGKYNIKTVKKYLDQKITTAVNNSYEIAKSYTEEVRTKTQSEIILVAYDLNKSINFLNSNINQFKSFLNTQKLVRDVDEVHVIEKDGKLFLSTLEDISLYHPPLADALEMVLNDKRPLKIIDARKNRSASLIKLENFEGKYLYIVKYLVQYQLP